MSARRASDRSTARDGGSSARSAEQLPSGRHGLPREFVIRNQQTRIIDGLARVVARKGYGATTVAEVLEESGVSRRTFYEHYRSKEDCFLKAFDAIVDGIIRRVAAVYEEEGPWPQRVRRALEAFLDLLHREPDLARMCLVEALSAGPEAGIRYARAVSRFQDFFEDAAKHSPYRDRLPEHLSWAVEGGILGVVYRLLASGREEELPKQLPKLVYFGLAPYIGAEAALEALETARSTVRR